MSPTFSIPFYAKSVLLIIGFFFLGYIFYLGQGIILPIFFAVILAILLLPPSRWLIKKKINRVLAILITLIISTLLIVSIGLLLFSQAKYFAESLPSLIDKFQELFKQVADWGSGYFHLSHENIDEMVGNIRDNILKNSSGFIGGTLTVTGKFLALLVLIPVYVFLILFYQPLFTDFINQVSGKNNTQVRKILAETKRIIQSYLVGLLIEASIMATVTLIGLLILGIEYALFLALVSALLNIIPYVGVFIATLFSMTIALLTKSPLDAFYVLILYSIIQIVDNNYIFPKIVGGRVKINALVSIIVVIAGGTLWGIPGMFVSIPIIAIIKVICDSVESLKPYGYLLGDSMPGKELSLIGKPHK